MDINLVDTAFGAAALWVGSRIAGQIIKEKVAEIRTRREAFEAHIRLCAEKAKAFALLEQRVVTVEKQIEEDRRNRHWIGDCVQIIGTKMNAHLPERPQ